MMPKESKEVRLECKVKKCIGQFTTPQIASLFKNRQIYQLRTLHSSLYCSEKKLYYFICHFAKNIVSEIICSKMRGFAENTIKHL